MTFQRILDRICVTVNNIAKFIGIVGTGLCVSVIMLQVVTRYVFKLAIPWQEDVAKYCQAWNLFMLSSVLIYESRHICVNIVKEKFKSVKAQHILNIIIYLIVMAFVSCLLYFGARQTIHSIPQSWASIPGLSMAWVYVAVPIGSLFMLLQSLKVVVDNYISIIILARGQGGESQ